MNLNNLSARIVLTNELCLIVFEQKIEKNLKREQIMFKIFEQINFEKNFE